MKIASELITACWAVERTGISTGSYTAMLLKKGQARQTHFFTDSKRQSGHMQREERKF